MPICALAAAVRRSAAAMSRAPLEQLRGQRQGDGRDGRRLILRAIVSAAGGLPMSNRDGVLECRTCDAEVEPLGARVLELRLRLRHVRALRDARLVANSV